MLASGHHSKSFLLRSRVSGLSRHQLSAEVGDGMVEVAVVCLSQNCTNAPPRGISLQHEVAVLVWRSKHGVRAEALLECDEGCLAVRRPLHEVWEGSSGQICKWSRYRTKPVNEAAIISG